MKKWTTTTSSNVVGLDRVLEIRRSLTSTNLNLGGLNEVECWSLLGQTGQALQDLLLSVNGRRNIRAADFVITPDRVLCSITGKVTLLIVGASIGEKDTFEFRHPMLDVQRAKSHNEREIEAVGIYSLAKTIEKSLGKSGVSSGLSSLLAEMSHPEVSKSTSLLKLLSTVTDEWRYKVGSSPISRFVSQLCKVSLAWEGNNAQNLKSIHANSAVALTNHDVRSNFVSHDRCVSTTNFHNSTAAHLTDIKFSTWEASTSWGKNVSSSWEGKNAQNMKSIHANSAVALTNHDVRNNFILHDRCVSTANFHNSPAAPLAEIEFSKLEASLSSSDDESNVVSGSSSMPDLTSPVQNNNVEMEISTPTSTKLFHFRRGQYGKRLNYHHEVEKEQDEEDDLYENVESYNLDRGKSSSVQDVRPLSRRHQPKMGGIGLKKDGKGEFPVVSHNHHHRLPKTVRTAASASVVSQCGTRRVRSQSVTPSVKRNPSRLYRVVKPLTEVTPTPSPATKRCVGPEFIVMASEKEEAAANVLMLNNRSKEQNFNNIKQVSVRMLNGQRISVRCNPNSVSAGEILDAVLSHQDIKESFYFALAVKNPESEYLILAPDVKPFKFASPAQSPLHLRFKFYPSSVDDFKDPRNKHQLYLQLRKDVIENNAYKLSDGQHLTLASLALQTEFGDFSEDIHGSGDGTGYFLPEHYLPGEVIKKLGGGEEAIKALTRLHRAQLGQSQSKTEIKFTKEISKLDQFGLHLYSVSDSKKGRSKRRHLGIHVRGLFLFEQQQQHRLAGSFPWKKITRIQYDKTRFQISFRDEKTAKEDKVKFYVNEMKARVMFDLSSSHHQFHIQQRWNSTNSAPIPNRVEYKEPVARSLKNKLMSAKKQTQSHNRKLYPEKVSPLVKRLTHYTSMAKHNNAPVDELELSNKENFTPHQYKYKVYLEPHDDNNVESTDPNEARIPLQEKPITTDSSLSSSSSSPPPPLPPPRSQSVSAKGKIHQQHRRRSETLPQPPPPLPKKSSRKSIGNTSTAMRMGTKLSFSALHRERLRYEFTPSTPAAKKQKSLDLDYDTMEVKSLLPRVLSVEQQTTAVSLQREPPPIYDDPESLSNSLIERFDNMDAETSEPERQIVAVDLAKSETGRLGIKISGREDGGIYIDSFDRGDFKVGDRIVAINGRSLENVPYATALDLIRRSGNAVNFLVSQIK